MTQPTYVGTTQSNNPADLATPNTGLARTTPSYSTAAGAILVGCAFSDDSSNKSLDNISGGPAWTPRYWDNTANKCSTFLYTATSAGGSITSSVNSSSSSNNCMGIAVLQFTGSDGIGNANTASGTSGTPSVQLTTSQTDSAVVMLVTDWSAVTGTSTFPVVNGSTPVEVVDYADGANYGVHIAYWPNVGASGVQRTYSMSAPSGQNWTAQVIEVKGTVGGGSSTPVMLMMKGLG